MTLDELRAEYTACVKILRAERAMRERVFGVAEPAKRDKKVGEIDRVIQLLESMKDLAKDQLAVPEQAQLLDVPPKRVYP